MPWPQALADPRRGAAARGELRQAVGAAAAADAIQVSPRAIGAAT